MNRSIRKVGTESGTISEYLGGSQGVSVRFNLNKTPYFKGFMTLGVRPAGLE